jgi:hypothetical protein
MCTHLRFETTFHPLTDSLLERTNQNLKDMPWVWISDFRKMGLCIHLWLGLLTIPVARWLLKFRLMRCSTDESANYYYIEMMLVRESHVGPYQVALSPKLVGKHEVFHVLMLRFKDLIRMIDLFSWFVLDFGLSYYSYQTLLVGLRMRSYFKKHMIMAKIPTDQLWAELQVFGIEGLRGQVWRWWGYHG